MLLSLDANVFNSASGNIPTSPISSGGNPSKFGGVGVTTVASSRVNIPSGLAVTVFADYSCWCPTLQAFIPPEATNISSKLNLGSGS